MGSDHLAEGGDWLGRICEPIGLPWGTPPKPSNEMPVHWVEFRRGFWIAKTEITNEQYERFEPNHDRGDYSDGDREPVVGVTWGESEGYCQWLAERSARPVRLPSESEWECACRAGSQTEYCFGDDSSRLADYAWFSENSAERLHEVATRKPNRWGIHDMHGNARERCDDFWHDSLAATPPDGTAYRSGELPVRAIRGFGAFAAAWDCRSATRAGFFDGRAFETGFRPAFSISDD
jgi:formylglycine-generating enzyme required for sulfatase activity